MKKLKRFLHWLLRGNPIYITMMVFFLTAMLYIGLSSVGSHRKGPIFPNLETYTGSLVLRYREVQLRTLSVMDSSSELEDSRITEKPYTIVLTGRFVDISTPKESIIYQVNRKRIYEKDGKQVMVLTANRERTGQSPGADVWFYLMEGKGDVTLLMKFGGLVYVEYIIESWKAIGGIIKKI